MRFRLLSVKKHEESEKHQKGVGIMAARHAEPGSSKAERMIKKMKETTIHRLEHLFKKAHAMAKQCWPFTDYVWLCQLDNAKGLDIGTSYQNNCTAQVFIQFIA